MRAADGSTLLYRVLGDQPYVAEGDPFGFVKLAKELRSLILASRASTPFTIGIEASWGRGKSSLMAQLENQLKPKNRDDDGVEIRTVNFNAWTAEGEDVLEGLIKSVLQAMDRNVLRRALRNQKLLSGAKALLLVIADLLRVRTIVNEAWDKLSADARTRNQVNEVFRRAMNDWSKGMREAPLPTPNKLIVVFIDDLDRCSPENVLKIFEGLKLYLDAPGFVFVIGYDEGIISEAVMDQKRYSSRTTGRDYVEKIVQIVFRIPQPSPDEVENLLSRFVADSNTADLFEDPATRSLVVERNGRNPRRIKRFVNRFILDYQLDEASQDLEPKLLIKLLILETYFPEFTRLFTTRSDKNPIQEFLDFAEARDLLRSRAADDAAEAKIDAAFRALNNVARPDDRAEALEVLMHEVDEPLDRLVKDADFVSLAQSLKDANEQEQILAKVQRRKKRGIRLEPVGIASSAAVGTPVTARLYYGRRILWVDDKPENNAQIVELLTSWGATVETAVDSESAALLLTSHKPDLLISDIARGDRPEAGFEDLKSFREGLYDGPVIFFTARISAARRERAAELDAGIALDEAELLDAMSQALATPVPA